MNLKLGSEVEFADHCDLLLNHNVDIIHGTIYLSAKPSTDVDGAPEINSDLAAEVTKNVLLLSQVGHKEISVILNSPGGDVQQALAVYDVLRAFDGKIIVTVIGEAYSMGAILLQVGHERLLSPNSSVMIHDGTRNYNHARVKDYRKMSRLDDAIDKKCYDILLKGIKRTNKKMTLQKLKKLMASDEYLTAEEAVALGLADRIDE